MTTLRADLYDVTDPSELGTTATARDVARYNARQRRQLAAQFPCGVPDGRPEDDTDPVETYIDEHWMEWLS